MSKKVARLSAVFFATALLSLPVYARPQDTSDAPPVLKRSPSSTSQPSDSQTTAPQTTTPSQTTADPTPAPNTSSTTSSDSATGSSSADSSSNSDSKSKKKKSSSKDDCNPGAKSKNCDVDNIGTRNINSHQINFYSIDKEIALGRQLSAEVERQVKLLNDPVIGEYINRVGQNLVRNSDAKVPFTIKVVESDDVNAFALPGGFFYVNTGLIRTADSEAELAAVMGHEIAHVAARHGTENQSKADLINFGSIPLIFLGGPIGLAVRQTGGFLIPMGFLAFSRANESEADYLGLQYMYHAGYDPSAFVTMFEKLQAMESARAGSVSPMFATHPATAERIRDTKKNIETILAPKDQYVVTTSEFDDIKGRLASIENRRPDADDNNSNKPSLIRKGGSSRTADSRSGGNNGGSSGDDDSDKPVLRRRDGGDPNASSGDPDSGSSTSDSRTSASSRSDSSSGDDNDRPVLRRRDNGDSSTSSSNSDNGSSTSTSSGSSPSGSSTSSDSSNSSAQPSSTSPDGANSNSTQPSSDPDSTPVLIRKPGAGGSTPTPQP